jgi:hypothetical protein
MNKPAMAATILTVIIGLQWAMAGLQSYAAWHEPSKGAFVGHCFNAAGVALLGTLFLLLLLVVIVGSADAERP